MKKLLSLVVIAALAVSCSGLKVYSDKDPGVDFSKYSTFEYYGWADNSDAIMTSLDKERIESSFGAEFEKRGMKYVAEKGAGDVIVSLFIVTEGKQSTTAYTTHMGGGGFYGDWGYGYGGLGVSTTNYSTYDYTEGTLVVSMYDKDTKKLIWQSSGTGVIEENPEKRAKSMPSAIARIMAEYPVEAAK